MKISISDEDSAWYGCLATQHYVGPVGFKALLEAAGSAQAVYSHSESGLKALFPKINSVMAASIAQGPDFKAWEALVRECERLAIRMTAPVWDGFPEVLRALGAPPPLLYMRGAWVDADARAVALVGTRHPTDYGAEAARVLARDLCAAGFTVVSGLARGIDTAAHEGCLSTGGRTIAVIGCGLDVPYPPENEALRDRIAGCGAVISEHPPGTQPQRMHFPRRNLIISALSRAVVVVEAGEKSGALITAEQAQKQGRVLFAVPGSMFNPLARGSHALLRAGAALAASAEDVVLVLEGALQARPVQPPVPKSDPVLLKEDATVSGGKKRAWKKSVQAASVDPMEPVEPADPVLRLWSGDEACGLDALAARAVAENLWSAERAPAALIESLLVLEMKGQVERLPGPSYRRRRG
jgi:DNA processing protein